jgi:hypothetical protein
MACEADHFLAVADASPQLLVARSAGGGGPYEQRVAPERLQDDAPQALPDRRQIRQLPVVLHPGGERASRPGALVSASPCWWAPHQRRHRRLPGRPARKAARQSLPKPSRPPAGHRADRGFCRRRRHRQAERSPEPGVGRRTDGERCQGSTGRIFGDIFERDNLDWQSREIATVSMLSRHREPSDRSCRNGREHCAVRRAGPDDPFHHQGAP